MKNKLIEVVEYIEDLFETQGVVTVTNVLNKFPEIFDPDSKEDFDTVCNLITNMKG